MSIIQFMHLISMISGHISKTQPQVRATLYCIINNNTEIGSFRYIKFQLDNEAKRTQTKKIE